MIKKLIAKIAGTVFATLLFPYHSPKYFYKTRKWWAQYLTQSREMRIFYLIIVGHLIAQIPMLFGVSQSRILAWMFIIAAVVIAYCIFIFIKRLVQYSLRNIFPSETFSLYFLKAIPKSMVIFVLGYYSFIGLIHATPETPLTLAGLVFIYGASLDAWLFYAMTRLINPKSEHFEE